MRHALVAATLALVAGPAFASGYSELNAGIAAVTRNDADTAVEHLSAALAAPDLPGRFLPLAHFDRAVAYAVKGDIKSALSDLNATIVVQPDWPEARKLRAFIENVLGDKAAALADINAAVAARPMPAAPTSAMSDLCMCSPHAIGRAPIRTL